MEVYQMKGETREAWEQYCAQAAVEQNPDKLLELVKEINRMLEEKEIRLLRRHQQSAGSLDKPSD
jgi:hypothetical protein